MPEMNAQEMIRKGIADIRAMRVLIACLAALMFAGPGASGLELPSDSSGITLRTPDAAEVSRISSSPEFSYLKDKDSGIPSWWNRFWAWLDHQLDQLRREKEGGGFWTFFLGRILPWLGVSLAVALVVLKTMGIGLDSFLMKKALPPGQAARAAAEVAGVHDFSESLEEALGRRDFRLAIRLYYLEMLRQLSDTGLVDWHPDKTNGHYYREIPLPAVKGSFGRLTTLFEYVWYGGFDAGETHFRQARAEFDTFRKILKDSPA